MSWWNVQEASLESCSIINVSKKKMPRLTVLVPDLVLVLSHYNIGMHGSVYVLHIIYQFGTVSIPSTCSVQNDRYAPIPTSMVNLGWCFIIIAAFACVFVHLWCYVPSYSCLLRCFVEFVFDSYFRFMIHNMLIKIWQLHLSSLYMSFLAYFIVILSYVPILNYGPWLNWVNLKFINVCKWEAIYSLKWEHCESKFWN